jgi:hypothetical protein
MPTTSVPRRRAGVVARAVLATAETVGFATYVHTQAGGHRPGLLQTAAVAAAVLIGALALFSRRARLGTIAVAVLGAQVVLHEGFSLAVAGPGDPHGPMSSMPGMAAPVLADASASGISPGWHMVLTHVVVGLLTVLVLACQDVALAAVVGGLRLLEQFTPLLVETVPGRPGRRPQSGGRPALFAVAPRRGPPRWSLLTP